MGQPNPWTTLGWRRSSAVRVQSVVIDRWFVDYITERRATDVIIIINSSLMPPPPLLPLLLLLLLDRSQSVASCSHADN